MPPEVIQRRDYDGRKCDIFSLGVVIFAIVVGCFPVEAAVKSDSLYRLIVDQNFEEYWKIFEPGYIKEIGEPISKEFKILLGKMLNPRPRLRPTIQQVKSDPWM